MPTFEQFWDDLKKLAESGEIMPRPSRPKNTHYKVLNVTPWGAEIWSGMYLGHFFIERRQFRVLWDALQCETPYPCEKVRKDNIAPICAIFFYLHYAEPIEPYNHMRAALDCDHWLFINPKVDDASEAPGLSFSLQLEKTTPYFSLVRAGQQFLTCQFDQSAHSLILSGTGSVSVVESVYTRYSRDDPFGERSTVEIRETIPNRRVVTLREFVQFSTLPSLEDVGPPSESLDQWSQANEFQIVPLTPDEFDSIFEHVGSVSLRAGLQDAYQPIFEVARTSSDDSFLRERIAHLSQVNREKPLASGTSELSQRAPDRGLGDLLKAWYDHRCQICGFTFQQNNGRMYSETHHIQPKSEGGLDVESNLIVVCPNHHRILDSGQDSYVDWENKHVVLLGEPVQLMYDKHLFEENRWRKP